MSLFLAEDVGFLVNKIDEVSMMKNIVAPLASVLSSLNVKVGESVVAGQIVALVEAMKMQYSVTIEDDGVIETINAEVGDVLEVGDLICQLSPQPKKQILEHTKTPESELELDLDLETLHERIAKTSDDIRLSARKKRHERGYRTARENLADLIDDDSLNEYGQLAVAAQRSRKSKEELELDTAADGIITGTATINADTFGAKATRTVVVINDYSVLAGTQGYFHHHKLDRILEVAAQWSLPVVMYTEGGGGRPGDTDVQVSMAGLNVESFKAWASLNRVVPRIAVNNGYCFAGNAALFGCADIRIATKSSSIGMAGPAMIEGGGLGSFKAVEIGPIEVQSCNGVVDLVADNEAHATQLAQKALSYFQGLSASWSSKSQSQLRDAIPQERRQAYKVRDVLDIVVDNDSLFELQVDYADALITALARIEGRPVGIIANNCHSNGGAVDAVAAEKAAAFIQLCDAFNLPLVSFTDTPGFMVGPESEELGAVRKMSNLFLAMAGLSVPIVAIVLRKGYGLGAMAMTGGSMYAPVYTAAWPSGEFGAMGLEGAVRLGYKKELEQAEEGEERDALFQKLLDKMIKQGKAIEAASFLEIDAVIDPADTREVILRALDASAN